MMSLLQQILVTLATIVSMLNTQAHMKQAPLQSMQLGAVTQFVGGKQYFLNGSGVGATDTSITVTSLKRIVSNIILKMSDVGSIGYATIEPGSSTKQEFISFTGITQNSDGTATLTGVSRGLSDAFPYTASTTLQVAHGGGLGLVLSNSPGFYSQLVSRQNDETFTGTDYFNIPPVLNDNNATSTAQAASRSFVLNTAIQGAGTSTEGSMGISQLSTLGQRQDGTASSTEGRPLIIANKYGTSTPTTTAGYIPTTGSSGVINAQFIATSTTDDYRFGGTTTVNTFNIKAATTSLNSISYGLPSNQGTSSDVLMNRGNGLMTWQGFISTTSPTHSTSSPSHTWAATTTTMMQIRKKISGITGSQVVNAFNLPLSGTYALEIFLSAGGGDTTTANITVNGVATGTPSSVSVTGTVANLTDLTLVKSVRLEGVLASSTVSISVSSDGSDPNDDYFGVNVLGNIVPRFLIITP